jgi:SAM-dependent methyltransferase
MAHLRDLTNLIPQPIRFGLRRAFYRGPGATCVLCGARVRGLKAHGGGAAVLEARRVAGGMRREDDRCPVCHGRDRTRMIMLYLEAVAGIGRTPARILHVAPDLGLYLWLKRQPGVEYVASDIDASRYRHIDNIHTADLTAMPFESERFDIVICSHVLEHVPDDAAAMREILRLLRPGGRALLLTPFALDGAGTDEDPGLGDPGERDRRFGQWDHVRLYDRDDFVARMARAGFETAVFEPFASHPEAAGRLHLNPLEVLPVGVKPLPAAAAP